MANIRQIAQRIWVHPWSAAACNLLLIMALYTLSRLFFYLTNLPLYPGVTGSHLVELLLGGMRFDLTAVLYLSSVYLLLELLPLPARWRANRVFCKTKKWWFVIPNAIGLAVNSADMAYIRFTDRRTTCTFFSEFHNDGNLGTIFRQGLTDYWYITLFGLAVIALLVLCFRTGNAYRTCTRKPYYYVRETAFLLLSAYFMIIGIRGGFGKYTRPITISNAMQYVDRPSETAIVLNTPFSLMKSLENQTYINPHYFPEDELESIMTPVHPAMSEAVTDTLMSDRPNVVILILESFAAEHVGFFNHHLDNGTYQGFTPFLDSLLAQSVTYTHSYASGRISIDAMPSVLSSLPMMIEHYIVTPYSTNSVSSVADVLSREGYTTAFFHGAPNGSMGFQAYAHSAGFQAYYGLDEYDGPSAFDGTWGIWDEEFLQYYGRTMTQLPQPFCTAVFSLSSHHPFKLPARYEGCFPEGPQPICRSIAYSDHALREFFRLAKQQPWFQNTLFVITADYTSQLYHPEYINDEGLFRIPIAFYMPARLSPKMDTTTVISQTDIMPSVLAQIGYTGPYFAFGEDALTQAKAHNYAICYNHPYYQIFAQDGMIQFDGTRVVNASESISPEEQDQMVQFLKATIQQYIGRMIQNRLTVEQ